MAAIGVSLGSSYLVERPFLMIKNRIGGRLDSTARPQAA